MNRTHAPLFTLARRPGGGHPLLRMAGFGLAELLVAVAIGMVTVVVMMQVFAQFEGQRRTTGSGDDAINSGSVSLYGLQRDMQQAGWGTSAVQVVGCNVTGLVAGGGAIPFAPVTINPVAITGEDTNTDVILVVSGSGNGTVEGDLISNSPGGGGTSYAVRTPSGFAVNDFVVVGRQSRAAGACALNATQVGGIVGNAVTVNAATANFTTQPNDLLFQLGANPVVRVYAVRNRNLTVCNWRISNCGSAANNNDPSVWVPIAANVVSLRAQYGRDTTAAGMDGAVDVWDQTIPTTATPISTNAARNMEACAITRIQAVRMALIARSSQPEKLNESGNHVTPVAPVWAGSDEVALGIDATEAAAVAVNVEHTSPSASWPTWQDFRYKIFQTVVPLRNVTSLGVTEEC